MLYVMYHVETCKRGPCVLFRLHWLISDYLSKNITMYVYDSRALASICGSLRCQD